MWLVAAIAGLLFLATGITPWSQIGSVAGQVGPVLLFLIGITVVAELSDAAGVFTAAAGWAARLGRGSVRRLFGLVVVLATVTTLVLSLDTTAVLLTPVVLALAASLEISPIPFAMATVWLANTASLLLPVSNLTNLLAMRTLGLSVTGFAGRTWLAAVLAVVVTVAVLTTRYRRDLRGRYQLPQPAPVQDRVLFRASGAVCLAVGPLFVAGANVAVVACAGAGILVVLFAVRQRSALRFGLVPWQLVLLVFGLFLVVRGGLDHGLGRVLTDAAGSASSAAGLGRMAGVSAVAANVVNNLPAFAALQPVAGASVPRTLSLLAGVNLGPLILLWGSLATLLWRERCEARDVRISAGQFAAVGLVGVPLLLAAAVLGLDLVGR
ncbi:MAG TPA: SLC13 family permease [Actinocrinis sp.]|nr:SLC13 family permease [Actinocrinis sp.]